MTGAFHSVEESRGIRWSNGAPPPGSVWVEQRSCDLVVVLTRRLQQENCVRVLLYRGASREARNQQAQTPFQVTHLQLTPTAGLGGV